VIVASEGACALLLRKQSTLQCNQDVGMSVVLDGGSFFAVSTLSDMQIASVAPADAPDCGA
jgi:hypothetical protein